MDHRYVPTTMLIKMKKGKEKERNECIEFSFRVVSDLKNVR